MIRVYLEKSSHVKGSKVPVTVEYSDALKYENLQIEIYDTAVRNPTSKLGCGTTPEKIDDNKVKVEFDTSNLKCGIYELKLVRFHSLEDDNILDQKDFVGQRDFERVLFEILDNDQDGLSKEELFKRVCEEETALEKEFLTPKDIRLSPDLPTQKLCVLVYIKGILIGTRLRFQDYELIPTGKGIDDLDQLNFVNEHLREQTKIDIVFQYEEALKNRAHSLYPVCVLHFPAVLVNDHENARDYCKSKAEKLISTLSLTRGASGEVFEIILYNSHTKQASKYAERGNYVGNFLTGSLAGESAESVATYISSLESNPFNDFVVGLHKEAKREKTPDFQFVRYWQILEVLAENQDYDPSDYLLDINDEKILDGDRELYCKGSVNIVFRLLKENCFTANEQTWRNVNIWFALRNAVAHHGGISKYTELKRAKVRDWAEVGFNEIQRNPSNDSLLRNLREDVKFVLMKLLGSGLNET